MDDTIRLYLSFVIVISVWTTRFDIKTTLSSWILGGRHESTLLHFASTLHFDSITSVVVDSVSRRPLHLARTTSVVVDSVSRRLLQLGSTISVVVELVSRRSLHSASITSVVVDLVSRRSLHSASNYFVVDIWVTTLHKSCSHRESTSTLRFVSCTYRTIRPCCALILHSLR